MWVPEHNWAKWLGSAVPILGALCEPTCASAPLPGQTHVLVGLSWGTLIGLGQTPEPCDSYLDLLEFTCR